MVQGQAPIGGLGCRLRPSEASDLQIIIPKYSERKQNNVLPTLDCGFYSAVTEGCERVCLNRTNPWIRHWIDTSPGSPFKLHGE